MTRNEMHAEAWIEAVAIRGSPESTVESYEDGLSTYLSWLSDRGLDVLQVTYGDLQDYVWYLEAAGYAEATLALDPRQVIDLNVLTTHGVHSPCGRTPRRR